MDSEYLLSRLKRIYDECQHAQRDNAEGRVGKTIVEEFNNLIADLKSEFDANEVIQDLESVNLTGTVGRPHPEDVQRVKMNVFAAADSLQIELDNFEEASESNDLPVIKLVQQQNVSQSVEVNNLIEQVNNLMIGDDDKEELKQIIDRFEDETESDETDAELLKQLYEEAKDHSKDIALKLGMKALKKGIDIVSPV